jgi:chlorobactene glucosyltransferase
MLLLFDTLLSLGLFPFIWRAYRGFRGWARVPLVGPPPAGAAPRVTILVPARNEARSIERCVRSLLAQDYPPERLHVVVADDRSTDATPRILARLAAEDGRLTVVRGTELPPGWQGKCWALHQAVQHADPESVYLLFTDADTVHEPRTLASVVRFADERRVDLLSLGTGQELGSLAERVLLPTILAVVVNASGSLSEVNDPTRPEVAKANGQFILFRAGSYRAVGGHAAVRAEIVEDFALARRAKHLGQRLLLADGRHLVRARMYRSARELWEGFTKNAFEETQRRPGGALGGLLTLPPLALGPYVATLVALRRLLRRGRLADALVLVQGLSQAAGLLLVSGLSATALGLPTRYALAQPLSSAFLWGILANSTWRTLSGRGVVWKGRTY